MNKTEQKAFNWLLKTGHTDIKFNSKRIDFETNQGFFEVKRGAKTREGRYSILLHGNQLDEIPQFSATVLVFEDDLDEPVAVIQPSDVKLGIVGNIIIHSVTENRNYPFCLITIRRGDRDKLDRLKITRFEPYWSVVHRLIEKLENYEKLNLTVN